MVHRSSFLALASFYIRTAMAIIRHQRMIKNPDPSKYLSASQHSRLKSVALVIWLLFSLISGCSQLLLAPTQPWAPPKARPRVLVVPISFSGIHVKSLEEIDRRYARELVDYIREVSYGQVNLNVKVISWVNMRRPVDEYRVSFRIYHIDERRDWETKQTLVLDAMNAIDKDYDLSSYDIIMIVPGCGTRDLGNTGYVLRGDSGFPDLRTRSGQLIPPTDVHHQDCPFPSLPHSLAHILGGYKHGQVMVPDLFDFRERSTPGPYRYANQWVGGKMGMQYTSPHVGPWDIMSQHGIKKSHHPSPYEGVTAQGMTSFTKIRLGWIRPEQIRTVNKEEVGRVLLSPLWKGGENILVVRLPIGRNRYYLVENRQRKGMDECLPTEGVLILKVDESIPDGHGPVKIMDAHPNVPFFDDAPFRVGEHYQDRKNGISIHILSKEIDSYWIEIRR